jgi:hypothetical protein
MLYAEFPSGQRLDFESPEALARAMTSIPRWHSDVMSEETGEKQVVWVPGDEE